MKIYMGNINEYSVDQLIPLVSGERALTSMKYRFGAYDSGKNDWVWKDVNLKRGVNDEVEIVVNK